MIYRRLGLRLVILLAQSQVRFISLFNGNTEVYENNNYFNTFHWTDIYTAETKRYISGAFSKSFQSQVPKVKSKILFTTKLMKEHASVADFASISRG